MQSLMVKYNVVMPNISQLKTQPTSFVDEDDYLVNQCQEAFIRYLSSKLQIENQNRLKTEEQSAQVIG